MAECGLAVIQGDTRGFEKYLQIVVIYTNFPSLHKRRALGKSESAKSELEDVVVTESEVRKGARRVATCV